MSKENGFLQLRRGVFEHVKNGRMSHMGALAFIYITSQADTRTGDWNGSASALAGELGMSPRTARDVLEKLSEAGYVKRFPIPGRHACYPIRVHNFLITDGEHRGEHVNARDSTGKDDFRYLSREQSVEDNGEQNGGHGAAQKRIETGDCRNTPQSKTSPSAPPEGFESFWRIYPLKQDKTRAIRAWRKIPPSEVPFVLAGVERAKQSEQWHKDKGQYIPLPSTFLNGRRWEDEAHLNGLAATVETEEIPLAKAYQ